MLPNNQKAQIYDQCLRESDQLQRDISRLKSEYPTNMPNDKLREVAEKQQRIDLLVKKLESLFS
mgnify:CR=1 FL=1